MVFEWTPDVEKAAQLLAEGELSYKEIAGQCNVTHQTIWNWRQRPEFSAKVQAIRDEIRAEIRGYGIAIIEQRVAALNDRWRRMKSVIEARAVDHAEVPGGDTGLLVRKLKNLGSGKDAQIVAEYEVDTGLLSELRAHEKQAAEELGQWTSKGQGEPDSKGDPEAVEYEVIRDEPDKVLPSAETG